MTNATTMRAEPYVVMLNCDTGTWRLVADPLRWEGQRHTITWASFATADEADACVKDLEAGNPRTRAWVTCPDEDA